MSTLNDKIVGCLLAFCAGDALSMPVHWYYNPSDIKSDFGRITEFKAPMAHHPSSIMQHASTGGHGRGTQQGDIIGSVILHGKKQFWGNKTKSVHYHQGMKAGENTLNIRCARLLWKSITKVGFYDAKSFINDYVSFMTTPGSHNDTYAESYHRDFFRNWSQGVDPMSCAGEEGHDTPSMGGLVSIPILVLLYHRDIDLCLEKCRQHLVLTHKSENLTTFMTVYVRILWSVLQKPTLLTPQEFRDLILFEANRSNIQVLQGLAKLVEKYPQRGDYRHDTNVIGGHFSPACYIDDSMPSLLYLAYKYADSVEEALIANTNVGGENCHRGAVLGALMGAAFGRSAIPDRFQSNLSEFNEIFQEINSFSAIVIDSQSS